MSVVVLRSFISRRVFVTFLHDQLLCIGSLTALIYQHSITPISLPCKLLLPVIGESFRSLFLMLFSGAGLRNGQGGQMPLQEVGLHIFVCPVQCNAMHWTEYRIT